MWACVHVYMYLCVHACVHACMCQLCVCMRVWFHADAHVKLKSVGMFKKNPFNVISLGHVLQIPSAAV